MSVRSFEKRNTLLRCTKCGEVISEDEVDYKVVRGYSDSYGMGGVAPEEYIEVCPNCGAEEMFEEIEREDDEENEE